jgi:hypothetical protein
MTVELRIKYEFALNAAAKAVVRGDREQAVFAAKIALRAANASKDARYRRAAFRALNTIRAI